MSQGKVAIRTSQEERRTQEVAARAARMTGSRRRVQRRRVARVLLACNARLGGMEALVVERTV